MNEAGAQKKRKLLVHAVLQGLAGLESGSLGSGDLHSLASAGIAGGAGGTVHNFEAAEAHDLHLFTGGQGLGHGLGEGGQNLLGVLLGESGFFGNSVYQFSFIHSDILLIIVGVAEWEYSKTDRGCQCLKALLDMEKANFYAFWKTQADVFTFFTGKADFLTVGRALTDRQEFP